MADVTAQKVVHIGSQQRRGRFRFRYLLVAAFLVWGGYVYLYVQRPMLENQARQQAQLDDQISAADSQADNLDRQIANLHTYKYIAAIAEQRYHLIAPGEILLVTSSAPAGTN